MTFPSVLFFFSFFARNIAEAEGCSLALPPRDKMSANACIIVFSWGPGGGSEPMCWWGMIPEFNLTALPTQLVALSLNTLRVSVCVCRPAHDKALFPESHAPKPLSSPPAFFCQLNLKRARCGQKRPNVIVWPHKRCIVPGFCWLRPSRPRLLLLLLHARPFVLHALKTWMHITPRDARWAASRQVSMKTKKYRNMDLPVN